MSFGAYLPDLAPVGHPGLLRADNVFPVSGGYAPWPSLSSFQGALSDRCRGAASGRDANGQSFVVAGDATKLYLRKLGAIANATRLSGGSYTTLSTRGWSFARFNNAIYAANYDDEIQKLDLGGANFANLGAANAPRARTLAVVRDFLVAGYCYDPTGSPSPVGLVPNRVHWSEKGNPDSWPLYGTSAAVNVQSDKQELQGGEVQRIASHAEIGLVLMDRAVWRMDYVGGDVIFEFHPISRDEGTIAPGSVVTRGRTTYFWSEDGWKATDGSSVAPIGHQQIDETFRAKLDVANRHLMSGASHPRKRAIVWSYPSAGTMRLLLYEEQLGRWAEGDEVVEWLLESLPAGYSMDDYSLPTYDMDAAPAPFTGNSLDDGRYLGFPWDMGGFSSSHTLGLFSGTARTAAVETGDLELLPNRRSVVRRLRVVGDTQSLLVAVGTKSRPYDTVSYTPYAVIEQDGSLSVRANGRYHRALIIGSNFTKLQGLDAEAQPEGGR